MPSFKVNTSIPVTDIMSSPVLTVIEDDSVEHVARVITDRDVGSIVVTDRKGNPVGLITERDIAIRVTINNLLPSKVDAQKVMRSPLRTNSPKYRCKGSRENNEKV